VWAAAITGRRQETLDEAVKLIGRNVTGVRGDASNLDDLDRLFDTVKREKGKIDVLYASAGIGEAIPLGEITEQHFDATFDLNTRGTLFYGSEGVATVQRWRIDLHDRVSCFGERLCWFRRVCGE
jgi:NAD(P)-dependent dehydrogenase (short-subunit alcohol dehydrogenase family)